jgi:NTP pyrophosphatase (non-canonical NTP hydrolase)
MKKLQKDIQTYLIERGWDKNMTPPDISKSISIEAAELLELFQWGHISKEKLIENKELFSNVKKELADVFIYCFDMAVTLDIDAETIVREKLELVKKKYPATKMTGKNGDKEYGRIKQAYRKKS